MPIKSGLLGGFVTAKKRALVNADNGHTIFEPVPLLYVFWFFWAFWAFDLGKRLGGWAVVGRFRVRFYPVLASRKQASLVYTESLCKRPSLISSEARTRNTEPAQARSGGPSGLESGARVGARVMDPSHR